MSAMMMAGFEHKLLQMKRINHYRCMRYYDVAGANYYDELQIDTCTLRPSTLRVHKSKLLNHTTLFMALISFQNELNRCGLFLHQRHTL